MAGKIKNSGTGIGLGVDRGGLVTGEASTFLIKGQAQQEFYQFLTAEVIDVDLNPSEPEGMGRVHFRFVDDSGRADDQLNWAYPLNSNIKIYPILHEYVVIVDFMGKYFWFPPLNINNFINNNFSKQAADAQTKKNSDSEGDYKETISSGIPNSVDEKNSNLGKTFIDKKSSVGVLSPNEGDIIFEGRFGNTIRLGNTPEKNNPNIKINLKEYDDFELSTEKIDTDSCIWITSDERLEFTPFSPVISEINSPPNEYVGKQISLFSDRIIIGSKENEILIFSKKSILASCNENFSVDTEKMVVIKAGDSVDINTKKKFIVIADDGIDINTKKNINITSDGEYKLQAIKTMIGNLNSDEPLVLGNKWKEVMILLIDIILSHKHPTGTGPTGTVLPPFDSQFRNIKKSIANNEHLSDDNFTSKRNK